MIGCGGGGSSSTASSSAGTTFFSGTAMDGYLYKATVFLDLNDNGSYDTGEPIATTSETGTFTLSATQEQINTYKVVVVAVAGTTIDQDSPNTTVTSSFTMISPAGNHEVVSPLTTQVVAKMSTGLSLANAKTAVQVDLGLTSIDVMKNYVAAKATDTNYAKAHNVATSLAEVLKTIEADSTKDTKLADKLANIRTKVTSQIIPNIELIKAASSTTVALQITNTVNEVQTITQVMNYSPERKKGMLFNAEVADINNDGLEDVILAGWTVDWVDGERNSLIPIKILIQKSDGTLEDKTSELIKGGDNFVYGAQRILVEDFDGDGRLDIFLGGFQDQPSHNAPSVMFWNNGSTFTRVDFAEKVWAHGVCAGDLFGTGRKDILTGGYGSQQPYTLYKNKGDRLFQLETSISDLTIASAGSCSVLKDTKTGNIGIISTNMTGGKSHSAYIMIYDSKMKFIKSLPLPGSKEIDGWNLVHDLVNIIQYDLNDDGLMDLILTDNGDFRLNQPLGRFLVLINQGDFSFTDKTADYFPTQTNNYIFGYYTRVMDYKSKKNFFVGNPAVQRTTSLWEFDGTKFTPQMADIFTTTTAPNYSFIVPYKTKSGALNLLMQTSEVLGEYRLYTKKMQ